VISKTLISYSDTSQNNHEFMPCIIFTTGLYIQEILIYLPFQNFTFHRELKYHFVPKMDYQCSVCLDEKLCINVHDNQYNHCVCSECILKIEDTCPVCRLTIV
jgi:hypothetical protein